MMTTNTIGTLTTILSLAGLGACASTGTTEPGRSLCRPAATAALVGKVALDDAAILQTTGSTVVRRIAPGDVTTKDFREERVTITIADGQVIAASCG